MKTSEFDYFLPSERIAQHPAEQRDQSRMMVVHRESGCLENRVFSDFPDFMRPGDLLIVNNTRVIPARIVGQKASSGGKVEILLLEEADPGIWDILLHASRRPKAGSKIILGGGRAEAELLQDGEKGKARIRIQSDRPWKEVLDEIGDPPLPPYIKRSVIGDRKADRERYQTVYAKHPGAVAAPTAGLHFTDEVFQRLGEKGVRSAEVTLHVGFGTFRAVDTEEVTHHKMEEERYWVPEETARAIADTRKNGSRVFAIGSTTVRVLESVAKKFGRVLPDQGRTDLFIYPPFTFRVVDSLLTNFHLPRSSLLMLISAFADKELILRAYHEAVEKKYRFYSYGDCMLIL